MVIFNVILECLSNCEDPYYATRIDIPVLTTTSFDRAMHECKSRRRALWYNDGWYGDFDESLRIEKVIFDTEGIGHEKVIYKVHHPAANQAR